MSSVFQERGAEAAEFERTRVQGTARSCSSKFGKVCKALWPTKTAETLAAIVGCSVRKAGYEISGDRKPSGLSLLAVLNEITPEADKVCRRRH